VLWKGCVPAVCSIVPSFLVVSQAVNLILGFKPGEPEPVRQAKACYFDTKDPVAALKLMPVFMHVEVCILRGLARHGPTQFRLALLYVKLCRAMRCVLLPLASRLPISSRVCVWQSVASSNATAVPPRLPVVPVEPRGDETPQ
jgi:hypothetical protein